MGGGFQISFVSFPTAINLLPAGVSHFFAVFFFLFLLFLGIDSSMALAEAVTITLRDHVPFFRSRPGVTAGMTCGAAFLLGLVMCTEGGEAVMDIMDHYTANYCVLLIGLFECLSVWAYEYNGAAVGWTKDKQKSWRDVVFSSRLEQEMLKITGQSLKWLPFYWSFLVKFIAPVLITTLFAIMVYEDSVEVYGGYPIGPRSSSDGSCVSFFPSEPSLLACSSQCILMSRTLDRSIVWKKILSPRKRP